MRRVQLCVVVSVKLLYLVQQPPELEQQGLHLQHIFGNAVVGRPIQGSYNRLISWVAIQYSWNQCSGAIDTQILVDGQSAVAAIVFNLRVDLYLTQPLKTAVKIGGKVPDR